MLRKFIDVVCLPSVRQFCRCQVARIVVLLVWLPAAAEGADADKASIRVQPDLCMTTAQQPRCELTVAIDWQAPEAADFCVRDSLPDSPAVRCWQQAETGAATDSRFVDRSFEYLLTDDQEAAGERTVAARARVKVLAARSTDRRRNRRRRHVWSVL